MRCACEHAVRMSKMVQIRNVPGSLHRRLKERAAREGKTLSGYLLEELEQIASQPTLGEWFERLREEPPVRTRRSAAEYVREGRDEP